MKGGTKQLWLRNNRQRVLDFYREAGKDETLIKFNMTESTFERFLGSNKEPVYYTKADRAFIMAETARVAANECKSEVVNLRRQLEGFEVAVTDHLVKRVFEPLAREAMQLPKFKYQELPKATEVDVDKEIRL